MFLSTMLGLGGRHEKPKPETGPPARPFEEMKEKGTHHLALLYAQEAQMFKDPEELSELEQEMIESPPHWWKLDFSAAETKMLFTRFKTDEAFKAAVQQAAQHPEPFSAPYPEEGVEPPMASVG